MENPTLSKAISLTAGVAGAVAIGKYAHKHGNKNLIVAAYILAGFAVAYSVSDIVLLKAKIKQDSGWDGLTSVIGAGFGVGLLAATRITAHFVGKK